MRSKLTPKELEALEKRIRMLMLGVDMRMGYFSISSPSYCEAFGMIQALDVLNLGTISGPRLRKFDLRAWFDEVMTRIIAERKESVPQCGGTHRCSK